MTTPPAFPSATDVTDPPGRGDAPAPEADAPAGAGDRRGGGPGWRSPVALLRAGWRQLTSMRTALFLLFLLALGAVPGSLLPQRPLNPLKVRDYYTSHPTLAPLFNRLSLFDVFGAPWFAAIYLLLFASLIGCVVPRLRQHVRALLAPPPAAPARLDRLPFAARARTSTAPEDVAAAARRELRRRRWKVRTTVEDDGSVSVAAERGRSRETGNLLFHASLLLLLVGVGIGAVFGYDGTRLLVEGQTFTNGPLSYDSLRHGALVDTGKLQPFTVKLDKFNATYQEDGTPKTFDAQTSITDSLDGPSRNVDLRVNHPEVFGASKVYLVGRGYAPHITVKDANGVVRFSDAVPCLPQDASFFSICTVKVPDTGIPPKGDLQTPQQIGLNIFFFPSPAVNADGAIYSRGAFADHPVMSVLPWIGDLQVNTGDPMSVYTLDTSRMERATPGFISIDDPARQTMALPDGLTMTVDGYQRWVTIQVKHDPAKKLTLAAAGLVLVGLMMSLGIKRRRVWLRARPGEEGRTLVEVGGLTRSDTDTFADGFPDLARALVRAAPRRED